MYDALALWSGIALVGILGLWLVSRWWAGPHADALEGVRRWLYPRLDPYLQPVGGFATASVSRRQLVGHVRMEPNALEQALYAAGFRRNWIAALKSRAGGTDVSEGSWVYRESFWSHRQLHLTLFVEDGGLVAIYAHDEYSWRRHPIKHLQSVDFRPGAGAAAARRRLRDAGLTVRR